MKCPSCGKRILRGQCSGCGARMVDGVMVYEKGMRSKGERRADRIFGNILCEECELSFPKSKNCYQLSPEGRYFICPVCRRRYE